MSIVKRTAVMALILVSLDAAMWAYAEEPAKSESKTSETQEHMRGMGGMMGEGMLQMPQMDPARGRTLFAAKGCVVCHSINGVGGEDAPALDASTMTPMMNPFEFAARMWRGAEAMVMMQRDELGHQIQFTGDELADIVAFVHSPGQQAKFGATDIPENIRELMEHEEEGEHHD